MQTAKFILNLSKYFLNKFAIFDKSLFSNLPHFTNDSNSDRFQSVDNLSSDRRDFLSNLKRIDNDDGRTRNVYMLSDQLVIKVAKNIDGIDANKNEFECYQKGSSDLLPKVHEASDDFSWIISDYAKRCDGFSEISDFFKVDNDIFLFLMSAREYVSSFQEVVADLLENKFEYTDEDVFFSLMRDYGITIDSRKKLESALKNPKIIELDELIQKLNLAPYELGDYFNWGKDNNGNIVIIDTGQIL